MLEIKNLKISLIELKKQQDLVHSISFKVNKGETVCLIGESGSGKTMTALSILQIFPIEQIKITDGSIYFTEANKTHELSSMTSKEIRQFRGNKIGFIFQEPMKSLNPVLSIGYQIMEHLIYHLQISKKQAKEKAIQLLEEVEIPEARKRLYSYPHQLSGGMKQRVCIAIAIACQPSLLIADEPTTALDVTTQQQILNLLKNLQKKHKMSILFITHDFDVVKHIAHKVVLLKEGKIIEKNTVNKVLNAPKEDYTQHLLGSIPNVKYKGFYLNSKERIKKASKTSEKKTTSNLLQLNNMKTHFPIKKGFFKRTIGHVKAVDSLSLPIIEGKTTAILGESGCGKTTLIHSILGLLSISQGEMIFKNKHYSIKSLQRLNSFRNQIQIIFQDPYSSLNPKMQIQDILLDGMKYYHKNNSHQENLEKIKYLLNEVELPTNILTRYPHEFSGGQRQRICIARALCLDPKFIICDEITSSLDVSIQATILNLLQKIQVQMNLTYLFITHNIKLVAYLADYIGIMQHGKIIEYNTTQKILKNPKNTYTQILLNSL